MKLKTFTRSNCGRCHASKHPSVRFTAGGVFSISSSGVELLKVKNGDFISFMQDEEKPKDWYLKPDPKDGFELRQVGARKGILGFGARAIMEKVYQSVKPEKKSFGFRICDPTIENGEKIYALLTSKVI